MKTIKILAVLFIACTVQANDLIYKSGFESEALIGGTITGLNESQLANGIQLLMFREPSGYTVKVFKKNGEFVFNLPVEPGNAYGVRIESLPKRPRMQTCVLSNANGIQQPQGVFNVNIDCTDQDWNWDEFNWDEGGWQ